MDFGSDENIRLIKESIANGDSLWQYELYTVVTRETCSYLKKYELKSFDVDDIVQEVLLKVISYLPIFLANADTFSVGQRNSWLKKIISDRTCDFFASRNIDFPVEDPFEYETEVEYDDDEINAKLTETIKKICRLKTSPEKIMAFLINKCVCAFYHRNNGSPDYIISKLNGLRLDEAFIQTKKEIQKIVTIEISDKTYIDLEKSVKKILEKDRNHIFYLDKKTISDSSNWIGKKIKDTSNKEDDENE